MRSMRKLMGQDVGIPRRAWREGPADAFLLGSHSRAREALDLSLRMQAQGYNAFVLGEDRSGRMTATLAYLRDGGGRALSDPSDWLYLNNFSDDAAPLAFRLGAGDGRRFFDALDRTLRRVFSMFDAALASPAHRERVDALYRDERQADEASRSAPDLSEPDTSGPAASATDGAREADRVETAVAHRRAVADEVRIDLDRQTLSTILESECPAFLAAFDGYPEIRRWLGDLRADLLRHVDILTAAKDETRRSRLFERYRVNLFVDHGESEAGVVLEATPTYENLFGQMEYRRVDGVAETNFLMIRPGSLHRANGGILVLRAEALSKEDLAWRHLKAALRDRVIRIEELHRVGSMPIAGLPRPQPIPLDVKVVIVGGRDCYFRSFADDAEFHSFFKIKADIDADMQASDDNQAHLGSLICAMAGRNGLRCTPPAVSLLLGLAARFAGRRDLLTAQFELLEDLVCEAGQFSEDPEAISPDSVYAAWQAQRRRNGRPEKRFFDSVQRGHIAIATSGMAVGQVNALTIRDLGEHRFGRPSRVTAQASMGRKGVVNIERVADLGGRVQQKGALVVEGYLRGTFGRQHPMSFDCSITFEQNYGGIDGDSASVAELVAIISILSGLPVRQNLAITGSFNQLGEVQSVGSLIEKVEGFFRATELERAAGLRHGVVLPASNEGDLVLEDEIVAAVEADVFSIWTVARVEEAIDLLCAAGPSVERASQAAYAAASEALERFDGLLWSRERLARPSEQPPRGSLARGDG